MPFGFLVFCSLSLQKYYNYIVTSNYFAKHVKVKQLIINGCF